MLVYVRRTPYSTTLVAAMTKGTSFTPDALPSMPEQSTSSASPTKRTFQSTLFNVKFGAQRNRLPPSKTDSGIAKRTRSQAVKAKMTATAVSHLKHLTLTQSVPNLILHRLPPLQQRQIAPSWPLQSGHSLLFLLNIQNRRSTRCRHLLQARFHRSRSRRRMETRTRSSTRMVSPQA